MIGLAAYTTNSYDLTLTYSSLDNVVSKSYGTENSYSFTSSSYSSGTYWESEILDSRSFSSETSSTSGITSSGTSYTSSSGTGIFTSSTMLESSRIYGGQTSWMSTYSDTWSRSMVSLSFSHTGITSIVTVSSYGNYTSRTTTYSNKGRTDTTVTSYINKTIANKNSEVVSVSRTDSWMNSLYSNSTTIDVECLVSKGVKSSIVSTASYITFYVGDLYYNVSSSSVKSILATRLSGTMFNSTVSRTWYSSSSTNTTIPGNSIVYTSLWFNTLIGWDEETFTYLMTSSTMTTVNGSSVSYLSATVFPKVETFSIESETQTYIHEWISYTDEHVEDMLYLGSQTLSITSQSSTTTMESDTHSSSWLDNEWEQYDSWPTTVAVPMADEISYSNEIVMTTTTTYTWYVDPFNPSAPAEYTTTTDYTNIAVNYESRYHKYSTWSSVDYTTWVYTTFSSTTGTSSTFYSSTTYSGLFGDDIPVELTTIGTLITTTYTGTKTDTWVLETTLSNYESNVITSYDSTSDSAVNNTSSNTFSGGISIEYPPYWISSTTNNL